MPRATNATPHPPAAPTLRNAAVGRRPAALSSIARYREAEFAAASPGQLIVLLFDKCVLTIRRAEAAFAGNDIAARTDHLCAAMDMVSGLRMSLDFEAGGDLSVQLDALYTFALRELFAANRLQDVTKLTPVLHVLSELRDGFAGAVAQLAAGSPAGQSGHAA